MLNGLPWKWTEIILSFSRLHSSTAFGALFDYEVYSKPCCVGPPKTYGSWWRVLTKCGSLEKRMANHFSILALRTPWTVWKSKKKKFGLRVQNEGRQMLTEFCQEDTLVIANTLLKQHKTWLYMWTSPDSQHWNQIDYIICSQRWRSSIQSAKTRPGADCGSDHELFIAKFIPKLKTVGKTTRPFRYDLNQIPYDYTVEVRNRFKGLDLIDRVW